MTRAGRNPKLFRGCDREFADVGAAWEHGDAPHYRRGLGVELMSEPRFGYIFGTTLRAGVAKGLDPAGSTKIYLRIGRSF